MLEWRNKTSSVLWQHVAEGKTLGERLRMNGNAGSLTMSEMNGWT